jgi:hypothetical protein
MKIISKMAGKLCLLVTFLFFAGCGGGSHSFEYHAADDPPPGPGLFSGSDGTFTIYQSNKEEETEETKSPSN